MIKFPGEQNDRKVQIIVGVFIVILTVMGVNKIWGQSQDSITLMTEEAPSMIKAEQQKNAHIPEQTTSQTTYGQTSEDGWGQKGEVVVFITGAVNKPGVVRLKEGSRIYDALQVTGLREDAAKDYLNQAEVLQDGQKYLVPTQLQAEQWAAKEQQDLENMKKAMGAAHSSSSQPARETRININTATARELEVIKGVGPSLSGAIIEYRNQKGKFNSIDELKEVPGIGDKKFEQMKDQVKI